MTNSPKFKVGDTIYWYCNEDGCVHSAEVQYVNFAMAGNDYIEVNYEVEVEISGEKKTLFIDDYDAMASDFSQLCRNNGQNNRKIITIVEYGNKQNSGGQL